MWSSRNAALYEWRCVELLCRVVVASLAVILILASVQSVRTRRVGCFFVTVCNCIVSGVLFSLGLISILNVVYP